MVDSTTKATSGSSEARSLVAVDDSRYPTVIPVEVLEVRGSDKSAAQQAKDVAKAGQPVQLTMSDGEVRLYRNPWSSRKAAPWHRVPCPSCEGRNWKHPRRRQCASCEKRSAPRVECVAASNRRRAKRYAEQEARGEVGIGE